MKRLIAVLFAVFLFVPTVYVEAESSDYEFVGQRADYRDNTLTIEVDIKHVPSDVTETGVITIKVPGSVRYLDEGYTDIFPETVFEYLGNEVKSGNYGDMNTDITSANFNVGFMYGISSYSWSEQVDEISQNPEGFIWGSSGPDAVAVFEGRSTKLGREAFSVSRSSARTGAEEYYANDSTTSSTYELSYTHSFSRTTCVRLHEFDHLMPKAGTDRLEFFYVIINQSGWGSFSYDGVSDRREDGKLIAASLAQGQYNLSNNVVSNMVISVKDVPFSDGVDEVVPEPSGGFIKVDVTKETVSEGQLVIEGMIETSSEVSSGNLIRATGEPVQGSITIGETTTRDDGTMLIPFQAWVAFDSMGTEDAVYYLSLENSEGNASEKKMTYAASGVKKDEQETSGNEGETNQEKKEDEILGGLSEEDKEEVKNIIKAITGSEGTDKVPGPENMAVVGVGVAAAPGLAALAEALAKLSGSFGGPSQGPDDGTGKGGKGSKPKSPDNQPDSDGQDQTEEDIDWSDPKHWGQRKTIVGKTDGRERVLIYNKTLKKWFYEESGTEFSQSDFDRFQDDLARDRADARKTTEKFMRRETAFDKAMDELVEDQRINEHMLKRLQHIRREIYFGSGKGLYRGEGVPGDVITKINEMESKMRGGVGLSEEDYQKIKKLYGKHLSGQTLTEDQLQDVSLIDEMKEGALLTTEEIARGESYKAMALKTLVGVATGGSSEIGFEAARAIYTMKDYVDQGGNSTWGGFKKAVGQVIEDEITGRVVEGGIKGAVKAGKGTVNFIKKNAGDIAQDINDAKKAALKKLKKFTETMSDNKKLAGKQLAEQTDDARNKAMELIRKNRKNIEGSDDLLKRDSAFFAGRREGFKKVQKLENARKLMEKYPDSKQAKKAFKQCVEEVQMDKHAMQQMNGIKGDSADRLRKSFNHQMEETYEVSIENTRKRIAKEYGVPLEDVQIVKATNNMDAAGDAVHRGYAKKPKGSVETTIFDQKVEAPTKKFDVRSDKVSFDKDVTFRVKQDGVIDPRTGKAAKGKVFADVPEADAKRIYNDEFYKAAKDGEVPIKKVEGRGMNVVDTDEIDDFAHRMDQTAGDRLSVESYGTGDADLKAALQDKMKKFSDVEGVGKTMEYKNDHWKEMADDFLDDAKMYDDHGFFEKGNEMRMAAEACREEGMRQTTKQFQNQIVDRVELINAAAGSQKVKIPDKLMTGIQIMDQVGKPGGISVAEAEVVLKTLDLTPEKVAQQSSSFLEGLQKFGFF